MVAKCRCGSKSEKLNESKCFPLFTQQRTPPRYSKRAPAGTSQRRTTDALTEQRYKHLYMISCLNDQCVVVGLPLCCRFQNTLGKICLCCRGRMFQGHSSHNVLKNLLHDFDELRVELRHGRSSPIWPSTTAGSAILNMAYIFTVGGSGRVNNPRSFKS